MNSKFAKLGVLILLLSLYSSFLIYKIKAPAADDLPRQITIGDEILRGNWDVLYKNTFSYTEPEYTFYNHHWLSGVVFALLHKVIGWGGLVVFKVLIFLLTFLIFFKTAAKKTNFWLVALVSIPVIFIIRERTGLRPEVFSYLFIALYVYILSKFEDNPKSNLVYWLVPLQLLWVNMHVFFSIGLMLVGGLLFEKVIHNWKKLKESLMVKKLGILFALVLLVSLINPRGINGVLYKYPNVSIEISENQTLIQSDRAGELKNDVSIFVFKPVFVLVIVSLLSYFIFRYRRKLSMSPQVYSDDTGYLRDVPIFYILGMTSTMLLSILVIRGMAMFGFMLLVAWPILLQEPYRRIRDRLYLFAPSKYKLIGVAFVILTVFSVTYFVYFSNSRFFKGYVEKGIGLASMSEGGVAFFKEHNLSGPIFNDTDIGSYLIHYLYPQEKVFADNRFGDAFSPSFWDDIYIPLLGSEENWQNYLEEYQFNVLFLYQYDNHPDFRQFLFNRLRDREWVLVYGDAFSLIFVRNVEKNKRVILEHGINSDNVYEKLDYLLESKVEDDLIAAADIFNLVGRIDLSRRTFLDVVINRPNNGKIWMIMAEWELLNQSEESTIISKMFLEKAIEVGYGTSEVYSFLGVSYYRLGRLDKAEEYLKKALKINPERADAIELMSIVRAKNVENE